MSKSILTGKPRSKIEDRRQKNERKLKARKTKTIRKITFQIMHTIAIVIIPVVFRDCPCVITDPCRQCQVLCTFTNFFSSSNCPRSLSTSEMMSFALYRLKCYFLHGKPMWFFLVVEWSSVSCTQKRDHFM